MVYFKVVDLCVSSKSSAQRGSKSVGLDVFTKIGSLYSEQPNVGCKGGL